MRTSLEMLYNALKWEKGHYWPKRTKEAVDNLKLPKISHTTAVIFKKCLDRKDLPYQSLASELACVKHAISQREKHPQDLVIAAGVTAGVLAGIAGYVDLVVAGVFNLMRHETVAAIVLPVGAYAFAKIVFPMVDVKGFDSFRNAKGAIKEYRQFFRENYQTLQASIAKQISEVDVNTIEGDLKWQHLTKALKQLEKAHAFSDFEIAD